MQTTAFQFDRQINRVIHVKRANHGNHRHHQFGHGERVVFISFDEQQARIRRHIQTNGSGDFRGVTPDPIAAHRATTLFIHLGQQNRNQFLRLLGGQLDRFVVLHLSFELIAHRGDDDDFFFIRTNDVVVKRRAVDDVARGFRNIGGFIDHGRRIARTGGDQALVGVFACGFHHRVTARHHEQFNTRIAEQTLRGFQVRHGDRHQQIGWPACRNDGFIEHSDGALRDFFRRRMRCKYNRIARRNHADGVVDDRCRRIGGRRDRGNHAPRRVFDQGQTVVTGQCLRCEALGTGRMTRL